MAFYEDASRLRTCYWFIRYSRSHKDLRRHYRGAVVAARALVSKGYDAELIRLYRLHLANPSRSGRLLRFADAFEEAFGATCPCRPNNF